MSTVAPSTRPCVLFAVLGWALLAGCTTIPQVTQNVITVSSCTANARAVRVTAEYTAAYVNAISWDGGSANIVGTPTINDLGGIVEITAELSNVALGEQVDLGLSATSLYGVTINVAEAEFFTVPPDLIVDPGCKAGSSPEFALADNAGSGLEIDVSAPSQPLTLSMMQFAESPDPLASSSLDWSDPDFNALPWHDAIVGSAVLDPAGPPLVVDLPESATSGTKVVLCRFISNDGDGELRGIVQTEISGPLATEATTWGAVKALYRPRE